jgi:hypothetical protein
MTLLREVCMIAWLIAGAMLGVPVAVAQENVARAVHVSPRGNDRHAGTSSKPLQTLAAARDLVRELRKTSAGPVRIVLHEGEYVATNVEFTAADSGSRHAPLVIESLPGKRATLVNGRTVPLSACTQVTDPTMLERLDPAARGNVVQLDLARAKITAPQKYPDVFTGHGGMPQLLQNEARLPLARWPDEGYVTMQTVLDSGLEPEPHGGTFVYAGDRPSRWKTALDEGGVWLMGFWRVPWTIQAVRVATIDDQRRTITLAAAVPGGIGSKYTRLVNGTRKGDGREPWYALNLVEEITRPGEWCIDFASRRLYLWPLDRKRNGRIVVCDATQPTITIASAAHVRLERLDFEGGLNEAIQVKDATDVTVAGCTVRATGGAGIKVLSGQRVQILSCDFFRIGAEAVFLTSGVRKSLTRGDSVIRNNHIHHTGELLRTVYAVVLDGVGNTVARNLIHDCPIGGISYGGNDHAIIDNEIHNIGLDAGDMGGIYTNGDWASRGTLIRGNLVHHAPGVNGVYLDDGHSGDVVENNIFYRVRSGLFLGGGHDNVGTGNLVVECQIGIHLDDRGLDRNYTIGADGVLTRFLRQIDLAREPWKSHYPALVKMIGNPDALPRATGNRLTGNALIGCATPWTLPKGPRGERVRQENTLDPNWAGPASAAGIRGAEALAFSLAGGSALLTALPTLSPPAAAGIGLFTDAWRTVLPTDEETRRLVPRPPRQIFDSQTDVDAHAKP